jgi:hypothetical protein
VLEKELDDLDGQYSKKSAGYVNNGSFCDDREDRAEVVEKIYNKLVQYSTSPSPTTLSTG